MAQACRIVSVAGRRYRDCATDVVAARTVASAPVLQDRTVSLANAHVFGALPCPETCPPEASGSTFATTVALDGKLCALLERGPLKDHLATIGVTVEYPKGAGVLELAAESAAALSSAQQVVVQRVAQCLQARGRDALDYSHFVSLPLVTPTACSQLEALQKSILADASAAENGIRPAAVHSAKQFHFTLCMLKLYSDAARQAAVQALESLRGEFAQILGSSPLCAELTGLHVMGSLPPERAQVVHMAPDPGAGSTATLRAVADAAVASFDRAGLLLDQDARPVLLHSTLLNSRFLARGNPRAPRPSMDVRRALATHGGAALDPIPVRSVELSQRGRFGPEGYYAALASVRL